ncbi:MAG: hypothetical protein CML94_04355 [Rhodobiaceae bacterium]|nr:hypothetical protein [Rhodobiaceae bacterium]
MKYNQYIILFFIINFLFYLASIQIFANQEANSKKSDEERYEEFQPDEKILKDQNINFPVDI